MATPHGARSVDPPACHGCRTHPSCHRPMPRPSGPTRGRGRGTLAEIPGGDHTRPLLGPARRALPSPSGRGPGALPLVAPGLGARPAPRARGLGGAQPAHRWRSGFRYRRFASRRCASRRLVKSSPVYARSHGPVWLAQEHQLRPQGAAGGGGGPPLPRYHLKPVGPPNDRRKTSLNFSRGRLRTRTFYIRKYLIVPRDGVKFFFPLPPWPYASMGYPVQTPVFRESRCIPFPLAASLFLSSIIANSEHSSPLGAWRSRTAGTHYPRANNPIARAVSSEASGPTHRLVLWTALHSHVWVLRTLSGLSCGNIRCSLRCSPRCGQRCIPSWVPWGSQRPRQWPRARHAIYLLRKPAVL